jgi:membrane protein YdbS with pleckstrin-like domain
MGDHSALMSTQERNPRSAVLRTVLAAVFGLFPLLNLVLAVVIDVLKPYEVQLPAWVFLGLNGALLAATILTALVTRILAVPGVNEWLRKYQILRWFTPEDDTK